LALILFNVLKKTLNKNSFYIFLSVLLLCKWFIIINNMTALEFTSEVQQLSCALKPAAMQLTRDPDEAQDLVQETLLKALTNQDKFKAGTNLKAWLYTIMRNSFINNYHKITRRSSQLVSDDAFVFLSADHRFIAQNGAAAAFILQDVRQAIRHLHQDFRRPFLMYFSGYKYLEIAAKLQIPIGTVKNRIHIARKELKQRLPVYNPAC
jgi:RNA polymerase sigma factor (sigma-70 family)